MAKQIVTDQALAEALAEMPETFTAAEFVQRFAETNEKDWDQVRQRFSGGQRFLNARLTDVDQDALAYLRHALGKYAKAHKKDLAKLPDGTFTKKIDAAKGAKASSKKKKKKR